MRWPKGWKLRWLKERGINYRVLAGAEYGYSALFYDGGWWLYPHGQESFYRASLQGIAAQGLHALLAEWATRKLEGKLR